ncbi:uncharacterized protein LOC142172073 [Nicotiana tabacum]|uniref:Uncharacterized protein LOC142172073 n=1 Tax=Nicotiana tabacum TaxID=4097 RepID=A0AC58T3Z5_TOBAC
MVSWDFVEEALKGYKFPAKFISLIMICVTSPKYTIRVNGEGYGFFDGKRDDLMIFCKGALAPVAKVMEDLSHFSKVTGLMANLDKSSIFLAGVDDQMKEDLVQQTGFMLDNKQNQYSLLQAIVLAGRLQVVTSVLFSLHSFWGETFILPQSVLKEVDKKYREYLWDNTEGKRKISHVAWKKICCPKKFGRLNIKGSRLWNIAYAGKLFWQLANKRDSLWVKWEHGIYMRNNTDIWNHQPPNDCSWYWKKITTLKMVMQDWYQQGSYILDPQGAYSISRSYNKLLGPLSGMRNAELIWSSISQSKHRFITWLAVQDRLLTKERLKRLQIYVEHDQCCLCDQMLEESSRHLFTDCIWIRKLKAELACWT